MAASWYRCFVLFKAASVEFRSSISLFAFNYFLHLINALMICFLDVWTLIVVGMMRYWFCVFDVYQICFVHWMTSYSTDLNFKKLLIKVDVDYPFRVEPLGCGLMFVSIAVFVLFVWYWLVLLSCYFSYCCFKLTTNLSMYKI